MSTSTHSDVEDRFDDWLSELEAIVEVRPDASFDEVLAACATVREQLEALPDLREQLERRFACLRMVDSFLASTQGHAGCPAISGFEVLELLGHGGMGAVYRARQVSLERDVALKVMLGGRFAAARSRERFVREARTGGRLHHPNITHFYKSGEAEGLPYIVQEFVSGGTLADRIAGSAQPARESAELITILADTVHYAHQNDVIHRDLKPTNILLTEDGQPKIADFGLAKALDDDSSLTRTGDSAGTPPYMAPEQFTGNAIGPWTDIYALGAILYELLTGRPPFAGKSSVEVFRNALTDPPTAPTRLVACVPLDLEAICLKCLEKLPGNRYASAADLAIDLQRFIAGEPTVARPLSATRRAARWAKRNPWLAGLGTAAMALLVLVAAISSFAAWRVARERDAAREALVAARLSRENELAARETAEASAAEANRQSQSAVAEAARARREAATSDRLSELLSGLFQSADPTGLGGLGLRRDIDAGRILTSRELLQQAANHVLSIAFEKEEPVVRARLMARLSRACRTAGLHEQSDRLSAEAMTALNASGLEVADADWSLVKQARGFLLADAFDINTAQQLLRESLAHAEQARRHGRMDDLQVADVKFDLGWLLAEYRALDPEGEKLLRDVLGTRRRLLGDGDHRTAMAATAVFAAAFRYQSEEQIRQFLVDELSPIFLAQPEGEIFSQIIQSLTLGYVARQGHDLERAIRHYQDAIKTTAQVDSFAAGSVGFSSDHPGMMLLWGELAGTYKQNGQYREAEEAILRVIEISDRILPNGHARLLDPLYEYARELGARGDFEAEAKIARRMLSICKAYPALSPRVALSSLLHATLRMENDALFLETIEESLPIVTAFHAENPTKTHAFLCEIVDLLEVDQDKSACAHCLQRFSEKSEELLAHDRTGLAAVHFAIARKWSGLHDGAKAQEHLDRCIALEIPSDDAPLSDVLMSKLSETALLEFEIGHLDLSEQHALRIIAQADGSPLSRAEALTLLARINLARRQPSEAIERYRQAIQELNAVSSGMQFACCLELAKAQLIAKQNHECYITTQQFMEHLCATPLNSSNCISATSDFIDVIGLLALLAERLPVSAEQITQQASHMRDNMFAKFDQMDDAAVVSQRIPVSLMARSRMTTMLHACPNAFGMEEQSLLKVTVGSEVIRLMEDAIEIIETHGKSFPKWTVRQELDAELGQWQLDLAQYSAAEVTLLAVFERVRSVLGERHDTAIAIADDIIRLYEEAGDLHKAAEFRQLVSPPGK